ncbi:MAG: ABC transporter ATP-binding protein [Armatimonadetes bacterium]|nr:ABC transporter ATP-binding protein [Armatimonadota bacterium]
MQSAIAVDGLFVQYRTKRGEMVDAVKDLTFQVQEGEIVGFLGPNGAGKSSTLKVLMGFVTPKSGRATIFGEQAGTPDSRKNIGYLPEVAMYYPFLTPLETLTMYGELQGLGGPSLNKEILELLEMLGIAGAAKKLNRSMSKGMLQRVGIAQALLGKPRLLILDEVTSGLDPVGRKELRNLLIQRQKEGATLFFSSHELAEVDMLCDRILLINKGEFVEERIVSQLKDELRNFALVFQGVTSMVGLSQDIQERGNETFEAKFHTKPDLIKAIERVQLGGGEILDVVSQEGSLEEYFVEKVQVAA